jgi:hypothetical protein
MDQLEQNGNVFLALSRIAIVFKFLHFRFGTGGGRSSKDPAAGALRFIEELKA